MAGQVFQGASVRCSAALLTALLAAAAVALVSADDNNSAITLDELGSRSYTRADLRSKLRGAATDNLIQNLELKNLERFYLQIYFTIMGAFISPENSVEAAIHGKCRGKTRLGPNGRCH